TILVALTSLRKRFHGNLPSHRAHDFVHHALPHRTESRADQRKPAVLARDELHHGAGRHDVAHPTLSCAHRRRLVGEEHQLGKLRSRDFHRWRGTGRVASLSNRLEDQYCFGNRQHGERAPIGGSGPCLLPRAGVGTKSAGRRVLSGRPWSDHTALTNYSVSAQVSDTRSSRPQLL